jgi:hypothetical protein
MISPAHPETRAADVPRSPEVKRKRVSIQNATPVEISDIRIYNDAGGEIANIISISSGSKEFKDLAIDGNDCTYTATFYKYNVAQTLKKSTDLCASDIILLK